MRQLTNEQVCQNSYNGVSGHMYNSVSGHMYNGVSGHIYSDVSDHMYHGLSDHLHNAHFTFHCTPRQADTSLCQMNVVTLQILCT